MTLQRALSAPPPRSLVDVFAETVLEYPDAPALDNGAEVLTYTEFREAADDVADSLNAQGVGPGDRVGVRISSGTTDLYVAIMGVLVAGAAYVPVDADDPDKRARAVFAEADVAAIIGNELAINMRRPATHRVTPARPATDLDAWVIFTSGSTGTPKGVAVSHRSAAGFVDAEAGLFLQDRPLGAGDRVMAGLSVAFDASCEEMWLAWRHGACLVPAPRSLVRSGMDLGPWLVANEITVVSTVPTLVALWPTESLDAVRLLILGGEACPPEIGARLAAEYREVWNTYGPTEATVVACAARLTGEEPVRIGLPLDGWDLAVVDESGHQVAPGDKGELIIGGIGLARYLDPVKDAEKYAPMPSLGWARAYRSGDVVRFDEEGLVFLGRGDDQVKLGGRRLELGEVDSALLALPGVVGAAAAVRSTAVGNRILIGYVKVEDGFEVGHALEDLRRSLPAALVPRLAVVPTIPTRTSGKVDRDALPWPVTAAEPRASRPSGLTQTAAWVQEQWRDILGAEADGAGDDFFDLGGGSLTAAQLVSRLRQRYPEVTVAHVYEHPRLGDLAAMLDEMAAPMARTERQVHPVPVKTQLGQVALSLPLRTLSGLRWLTWTLAGCNLAAGWWGTSWVPTVPWWWVFVGWLVLIAPPGRMLVTAGGARLILRGVTPGSYARGGRVHVRIWLAERLADDMGAANLAGAPWVRWYARALGARVGHHVDLHSVPPVTGMLTLGDGCSIEPEVDLSGHWVDGDLVHIGPVVVKAEARVGTRSILCPGAVVGKSAEVAPGSAVLGRIPKGEFWSGAPAERVGIARGPWNDTRPRNRPVWFLAYGAAAIALSLLPVAAVVAGLGTALLLSPRIVNTGSLGAAVLKALPVLPVATLAAFTVLALLIVFVVRVLGIRLESGHHPIHGLRAWQAWSILRLLDEARTWLFPLYSSTLTPMWLRVLGARIGKHVEASTVLLIPQLTSVNDGAFLADDTLLGGYELGGGWLRVERVKIGKNAFIGNSGMTAPGRKVPKKGLVAVLSAAPRRTKAKAGTSWIGSPPTKLRRVSEDTDTSRTYTPPTRLKVARVLVEACRVVPLVLAAGLAYGVTVALLALAEYGVWLAALLSGCVILVAGAVAAGATVAAKWALVGRIRAGSHPLWSSFVWRNELADTFLEVMAAPWFARPATGSPVLNIWLRALGARIGTGVWCETYWLPETDLIDLRSGATVNQGCVVQTHLFHDRVLSLDMVTLLEGATLGPNGVILPAARLGKHATVGPMSLVMRGESVPDRTRWIGNPIGPWLDELAGDER